MTILVLGLLVFLGAHLVPTLAPLRTALVARLGESAYKAGFSVLSLIGLALIVIGYAWAPAAPRLFSPFPGAHALAPALMIVSFILLAAANMKTHIRRSLSHPMLIGVGIWATVHLLANGELRATVLFGAFLAYVIVDLVSASKRNAVKKFKPSVRHDVIAILAGIVLALLLMAFHRPLFGTAVVPWGI